jgi:hypothetical protein
MIEGLLEKNFFVDRIYCIYANVIVLLCFYRLKKHRVKPGVMAVTYMDLYYDPLA